jgi:hypothetical protein
MSNQVGDRYTCSDPNCGCEVRIERPCAAASAGNETTGSTSTNRSEDAIAFHGASRLDRMSNDSPGATGEGVFGGSGSGRSATGSGIYDSATEMTGKDPALSSKNRHGSSLTCFCGSQMRLAGQNASAAGAR